MALLKIIVICLKQLRVAVVVLFQISLTAFYVLFHFFAFAIVEIILPHVTHDVTDGESVNIVAEQT